MTFVLDASLALAWCFQDESTEHTNRLLHSLRGTSAIAPSLWLFEVANGLVNGVRRGRITDDEARLFSSSLNSLPIQVLSASSQPSDALDQLRRLASEEGLSAYDAAYLALALELKVPLGTLDGTGRRQGLKQAAARRGIDLYSGA